MDQKLKRRADSKEQRRSSVVLRVPAVSCFALTGTVTVRCTFVKIELHRFIEHLANCGVLLNFRSITETKIKHTKHLSSVDCLIFVYCRRTFWHSRPQSLLSFWSAPWITTSGQTTDRTRFLSIRKVLCPLSYHRFFDLIYSWSPFSFLMAWQWKQEDFLKSIFSLSTSL